MSNIHTVSHSNAAQRLDLFCVKYMPVHSRSVLQKAIKSGHITVNNKQVKPRYIVRENDIVDITIKKTPQKTQSCKVKLNIPIIHEDENLLIINKPYGVAVHPGHGNASNTIAQWFIKKYPEARNTGEGVTRPGIVHRLDKDTSGVLILTKTQDAHRHIKAQFKKHRVHKEYLAIVFGTPKSKDGRITRPLARSKRNPMRRTVDETGKPAITEWEKEKTFQSKYALLRVFPHTGRTHQIRVHLHFIGYPIVGDALYTFKRQKSPHGVRRQMLHAERLRITLPSGKKKTFIAPLPDDFSSILASLKSG